MWRVLMEKNSPNTWYLPCRAGVLLAFWPLFEYVNVADIDRIEVLRGPAATIDMALMLRRDSHIHQAGQERRRACRFHLPVQGHGEILPFRR